ncbi:hypothetical protein N8878_08485 [Psychromonas sp.]|nr:hypothetical protein [Psychromonas sp.]
MNNPLKYTDPTGFYWGESAVNTAGNAIKRAWNAASNWVRSTFGQGAKTSRSNNSSGSSQGGSSLGPLGKGESASSDDLGYIVHTGDFYEHGTFEDQKFQDEHEPDFKNKWGAVQWTGHIAKVLAVDIATLGIGQIGMVYSLGENLWDVGKSLSAGNFKAALLEGDNTAGVVQTLYNLAVPHYGLYGGSGWGTNQWGILRLIVPLNNVDEASFKHDKDLNERNWIESSVFDGLNLPAGPFGLGYKALGTIPFAIKGAMDGEFKK